MEQQNKIILIVFSTLALIVLAVTMIWGSTSRQSLSPNILSLTQPVTSLTGKVTAVTNNTVTVTLVSDNASAKNSKQPSNAITYRVTVTDKTKFNRQVLPLDYDEKTKKRSGSNPSLQDVLKDDIVTILSKNDLRLVTDNSFEADSIILPSVQKMLAGTIEQVSPTEITVLTTGPAPAANNAADYSLSANTVHSYVIRISPRARLVKNSYSAGPQPGNAAQDVPFTSLQPAMTITVYLDKDLHETPLTMVYGEIVDSSALMPVGLPAVTSPPATNNLPVATPTPSHNP